MDTAEAVKQFMVRGSPGAMVARMLMATASLAPGALADIVAMMLEVRFLMLQAVQKTFSTGGTKLPDYHVDSRPQRGSVAQSQRTDAYIFCTVQACEMLASVDGALARALVAFAPRLMHVCRDHEELMAWMRWLVGTPCQSWEDGLDRFGKLRQCWGEEALVEQAWQLFVDRMMPMKASAYRNYLRGFNQLDRPGRSPAERVALLTALAGLQGADIPSFVYTVNALAKPDLVVGQAYEKLVLLLSKQSPSGWEGLPDAYDALRERYSGAALVPHILQMVQNLTKSAEGAAP